MNSVPDIVRVDTIEQYNRFFGFETRHPLVGVVRFDGTVSQIAYRMTLGFYALFIKKTAGCVINYGKTLYDFDDDTVVSFAPGQTVSVHKKEDGPVPESTGLLFHPDFLYRTQLGRCMDRYSFFSYASNEALHLSAEERIVLQDYMDKIVGELRRPIDRFSKSLIVSNIEVLLNYCMRFYERQFVTRENMNHDALARFEQLLGDYLHSGLAAAHGIPTVKYFADKICLSSNYFGDLVKQQTGKTAQELIQLKMISVAKEMMTAPAGTVKHVSEALGFSHPQHFVRFFKRQEGCTPKEFADRLMA